MDLPREGDSDKALDSMMATSDAGLAGDDDDANDDGWRSQVKLLTREDSLRRCPAA